VCVLVCVCGGVWVCVCVCVLVALRMQCATRIRHIVICGAPDSTVVFHVVS